jgi:hypothetical protein
MVISTSSSSEPLGSYIRKELWWGCVKKLVCHTLAYDYDVGQ